MGAYGSERTPQALQGFPVVDSEEEAEEVSRGQEMGAVAVPFQITVRAFVHLLIRLYPVNLWVVIAHLWAGAVLEAGCTRMNGLRARGIERQKTSSYGVSERAISARKCPEGNKCGGCGRKGGLL